MDITNNYKLISNIYIVVALITAMVVYIIIIYDATKKIKTHNKDFIDYLFFCFISLFGAMFFSLFWPFTICISIIYYINNILHESII